MIIVLVLRRKRYARIIPSFMKKHPATIKLFVKLLKKKNRHAYSPLRPPKYHSPYQIDLLEGLMFAF